VDGDEAGVYAPSQANGSNGPEDDPYNRAPFPWDDTPGTYGSEDHSLEAYYAQLATIRKNHSALRTGDFRTLLTDDTNYVYSFGRSDAGEKMVVALNNNTGTVSNISINVSGYIANGTVLTNALTGTTYTVNGSGIVVVPSLASKGALILSTKP